MGNNIKTTSANPLFWIRLPGGGAVAYTADHGAFVINRDGEKFVVALDGPAEKFEILGSRLSRVAAKRFAQDIYDERIAATQHRFRPMETVIHRTSKVTVTGQVSQVIGGRVSVLWDGWALPVWYDASEIMLDPATQAAWASFRAAEEAARSAAGR